ncbi:hypothetical protein ACP70R_046319 [Stipagrostis hirtigluma subsp. patula]
MDPQNLLDAFGGSKLERLAEDHTNGALASYVVAASSFLPPFAITSKVQFTATSTLIEITGTSFFCLSNSLSAGRLHHYTTLRQHQNRTLSAHRFNLWFCTAGEFADLITGIKLASKAKPGEPNQPGTGEVIQAAGAGEDKEANIGVAKDGKLRAGPDRGRSGAAAPGPQIPGPPDLSIIL